MGGIRYARPLAALIALCAVLGGGCAEYRMPRIDPTGERLFVPAPEPEHPHFKDVPGAPGNCDTVELMLNPRTTIAPVGSEVVLLAGVRGADNYLCTNERVEWQIAAGGVGEFVDFERGTFTDYLVGDFHRPHKVSSTFVIGSTSRRYVRLTRGTPTPNDDVYVLRGQTWVTVTSPVEGTSFVTAYAPDVFGWEQRKQSSIIHWVDAQWQFPAPAINPAGSRHVFTTLVVRQSDKTPCVGYRVQYSICDGPAAGFGPSGSPSIEVETNAAGQASAEILQQQPSPGTNRVTIQVIRPAQGNGPGGARLVVGSGFTSATWSAAGITLRKTGPATASVGTTLSYRIELSNPGDMPADGVVLTDEVPAQASVVSTNPPGQVMGRTLQWQVGRLAPAERRVFEVNLRADAAGSLSACAEAVTAGGLRAKDCALTSVGLALPSATPGLGPGCTAPPQTTLPPAAPPAGTMPTGVASLDVQMRVVDGRDRVNVGDKVTFEIVVTNRGTAPATGIVIRDEFDPGLVEQVKHLQSPIRNSLPGSLLPGQSQRIGVDFRAERPGRLCNSVEVTADGGVRARAEGCVTAASQGLLQPGPTGDGFLTPRTTTPGGTPSGPSPQAPPSGPAMTPSAGTITLNVSGPSTAAVGDSVEFVIQVTNTSSQPLANVKTLCDMDVTYLNPTRASPGHGYEGDTALFWTANTIAPNAKQTYRVECKCLIATPRACVRAKVTADAAAPASQDRCLEIRSPSTPASGLSVVVRGLHNPVTIGNSLTYVINVQNTGTTDEADVRLVVTIPPEMILTPLGTIGPEGVKPHPRGRVVEFDPVPRVVAGAPPLEYRIPVKAMKIGEVNVRAEITSREHPQPIPGEERTEIIGAK